MPTKKPAAKPYVIVRGSLATFCGFLEAQDGRAVTLSEARMIGYWEKRHMLSTLAQRGPEANHIRLSDATSEAQILDVTGVLVCSVAAAVDLRETATYEAK